MAVHAQPYGTQKMVMWPFDDHEQPYLLKMWDGWLQQNGENIEETTNKQNQP